MQVLKSDMFTLVEYNLELGEIPCCTYQPCIKLEQMLEPMRTLSNCLMFGNLYSQ